MLFKDVGTRLEFERIDKRLQFILFAIEGYLGEIIVTDLFRDSENSLHTEGKAADIIPKTYYHVDAWLARLKGFCDNHLIGVDVVISSHGTGKHAHLEIDPKINTKLEIILCK